MATHQSVPTQFLDRPEGQIGYDVAGSGPLVVCIPGMGDLRSSYRYLVPGLIDAGYRVATMDLRGHGDSDATFGSYDDEAAASDLLALTEHLVDSDRAHSGPAVLVGNSMGAGAAVIAAAQRPDLVDSLVLLGPFVRNPPARKALALLFRLLMARPWARPVWKAYLPSLYAGRKPADFADYREAVATAMARPGRTAAFSRTTHTTHAPAEAVVGEVKAATLVVMGRQDPDFTDPEAEAAWVRDALHGEVLMVDEAGHYPQSQRPDVVNPAVVQFLQTRAGRA